MGKMTESTLILNTLAKRSDGTSRNVQLPHYVIRETNMSFDIAFDLSGAADSKLSAFMSTDRQRLHVMGEKDYSDSVAEFLWIFALPTNVQISEITVDRKNNTYAIHIPKKKFWEQVRVLLDAEKFAVEAIC